MDLLDRMLDHDFWATNRLIDHARTLPDADLDRPFDLGHGSLRATFSHQAGAIVFWTAQMTGQPIPSSDPDPASSMSEIVNRFNAEHATFAATARLHRDQNRLEETFTDHNGNPITYAATILHVLHHTALHRAEEQHMLHRLGVPDVWDYDPQEWEWSTRQAPM